MDAEELLRRYAAGDRDFIGVDLSNANLSRMDLRGINLSRAYLDGANLMAANLSGACLAGTHFEATEIVKERNPKLMKNIQLTNEEVKLNCAVKTQL